MDNTRAVAILEEMENSALDALRRSLIAAAVRYAGIRARWYLELPDNRRNSRWYRYPNNRN